MFSRNDKLGSPNAHKDSINGHIITSSRKMTSPTSFESKVSAVTNDRRASPSSSKVSPNSFRESPLSGKSHLKPRSMSSESSSSMSSKSQKPDASSSKRARSYSIGEAPLLNKHSFNSSISTSPSSSHSSPKVKSARSSPTKSIVTGALLKKSSPLSNNDGKPKKMVCACRKSKCLKLYCVCFEAGLLCHAECTCNDCGNNTKTNDSNRKLMKAKQDCLKRKPDAFTKKPKRSGGPICGCRTSRWVRNFSFVCLTSVLNVSCFISRKMLKKVLRMFPERSNMQNWMHMRWLPK